MPAPSQDGRPPARGAVASPPGAALRAQIRAYLLHHLLDGQWPSGQRVPAESELMAMFGASRMTVHAVVRELQALGYLVRGQGKGSFVAEPRAHHSLISVPDPAEQIRERGQDYEFKIILKAQRPLVAGDGLAERLGIGTAVDHLVLLHLGNGAPAILEDRLVNPAMMPGLLDLDLAALSPFAWLMRRYPFPDSRHLIRAIGADEQDAARLGVAVGAPCLELSRITSVAGTPVTSVRLLHIGEHAAISGSVERQA